VTKQFLLKVAGEPGIRSIVVSEAVNAVAINAVVISEAANVVVSPEGANSIDDLIYVMVNP
jgi:hypothetical protein